MDADFEKDSHNAAGGVTPKEINDLSSTAGDDVQLKSASKLTSMRLG